jgi:predicted nucleic acid-binding Zn ribbon protein
MYCRKCGAANPDDAVRCAGCGEVLQKAPQPDPQSPQVPNYLVYAILATIFCCVPFGIVAIVYAAQVNALLQAGNYAAAREASNKARTWCWVAFGVGLLIAIGYVVMFVGAGLLAGIGIRGS